MQDCYEDNLIRRALLGSNLSVEENLMSRVSVWTCSYKMRDVSEFEVE